jgi:hypothetical protein
MPLRMRTHFLALKLTARGRAADFCLALLRHGPRHAIANRLLSRSLDAHMEAPAGMLARLKKVRSRDGLLQVLEHSALDASDVRASLREWYEWLARDPYRKDPGTELRTEIVRALVRAIEPMDRSLLQSAFSTYENLPRSRDDLAGGLRAAALAGLLHLDPDAAAHASVKALADDRLTLGSGEPHKTAVKILASLGENLLLEFHLRLGQPATTEALEAALEAITDKQPDVSCELGAKYARSSDMSLAAAGYDLLIRSPSSDCDDALVLTLKGETRMELFDYVILALAAAHRPSVLDHLSDDAGLADDRLDSVRRALTLTKIEP